MLETALRVVLGAVVLATAAAHPTQGVPKAVVRETAVQLGRVPRGATVEREVEIQNEGSAPLRILKAKMTPPLVLTRMPVQIAPGAQGTIRLKLDTAGVRGAFEGAIVLELDDPDRPRVQVDVEAHVFLSVEVAPIPAVFIVATRGEAKEASVEIINHEREPLAIRAVEHSSDRFTTRVEPIVEGQRYRLVVALKPNGPGGRHQEPIVVRTSSAAVPLLRIGANTFLREKVYTFPDQVDLGAIRLSDLRRNPALAQRLAQSLMVYQTGGTDFEVRLGSDVPFLRITSERGPRRDRVQSTIAVLPDKASAGAVRGTIVVETNDPAFPRLSVPVTGSLLD